MFAVKRTKIGFQRDLVSLDRFLVAITITFWTFGRSADGSIKSVYPACWPASGGTLLTINGDFPEWNKEDIEAYDSYNVTCAVKTLDRKRVQCLTGDATAAVADPTSLVDRIKIRFHLGVNVVVYKGPSGYEYAAHPTVDIGQTFGGGDDGNGTTFDNSTFWVRGMHFSCLRNVKIHGKDGGDYYESCRVQNDTHLSCRTLRLDPSPSDRPMPFGLLADWGRNTVSFAPPDVPEFTEFTVDGCCNVTVYGLNLDAGYGPDDLSVRFGDNSSVCRVVLVDSRRIACQLSPSDRPPTEIAVTVRSAITAIVPKKIAGRAYPKAAVTGVIGASAFVAAAAVAFACAFLLCLKNRKKYDLLSLRSRRSAVATSAIRKPVRSHRNNDDEMYVRMTLNDSRNL